jgi:hypothetical protein
LVLWRNSPRFKTFSTIPRLILNNKTHPSGKQGFALLGKMHVQNNHKLLTRTKMENTEVKESGKSGMLTFVIIIAVIIAALIGLKMIIG